MLNREKVSPLNVINKRRKKKAKKRKKQVSKIDVNNVYYKYVIDGLIAGVCSIIVYSDFVNNEIKSRTSGKNIYMIRLIIIIVLFVLVKSCLIT
jgi:hypothetical protein